MAWNDAILHAKDPSWQMPSLHSPGPGPALQALLAQAKRGNTGQQISDTLAKEAPELMKAYRAYRADQVAQTFLDQASNYDNQDPSQTEALARKINDQPGSAADAWAMLQKSRSNDLADQVKQSQADRYDAMANMYSAKAGNPYRPAGQARPPVQSWDNMVPVARGRLDDTGNFTNQYTGAENGDYVKLQSPTGKTITVPWNAYQSKLGSQPITTTPQSQPQAQASISANHGAAIQQAKAAIAAGANPDAVKKRLQDLGIDPNEL